MDDHDLEDDRLHEEKQALILDRAHLDYLEREHDFEIHCGGGIADLTRFHDKAVFTRPTLRDAIDAARHGEQPDASGSNA